MLRDEDVPEKEEDDYTPEESCLLPDGSAPSDQPESTHEDCPPRRSAWLRIIAFITVLAFLGLVASSSWPVIKGPLAELARESGRLKKDLDGRLLQAVVKVDVVYRKQGSFISLDQKTGTGFNISPDGVIVTNHHVIAGASSITISFPDGKTYRAGHWSGSPEYDLAVITLRESNLPVLPLNTTNLPASGDKISVVGNPLGLNNIVVEGKVERYMAAKDGPERIFVIDAPIYPGNSGSPVFDSSGRVIGVVFGSILLKDEGRERPAGLAVPIREVFPIDKQIKNDRTN